MKEIFYRQISVSISLQVSPALLLHISDGNWQRALLDKSGMLRNQMGIHSKSEMVAVKELPCAPSP
jgi:hypothetical protein